MNNQRSNYLIVILKRLLNGEKLSGIPHAKNSNQYFNIIKKYGIELAEVWKPNLTNFGRHNEGSLHHTTDNIERAKSYLSQLQDLKHRKPKKDEVQESRY